MKTQRTAMRPLSTLIIRTSTVLTAMVTTVGLSACGGEAEPTEHEHASMVVTQWNDSTELFLEYPHLLAGEATGNWAIHLTDMDDFKPIRSGTLTVRFTRGGAPAETFTVEGVARDGIFLLDPVVEEAGRYEVELALESEQANSQHTLPEVRVFATEAELPHASDEEASGIAFLKEQQWQIPFAVEPAMTDSVQRTATAPGEIVAPDGALVRVSAPVDGIAPAEANRSVPSVGQRVRAGDLLAVLQPTAQAEGFAQARASVERLEREVARAQRLLDVGAIAEKRLEEARHDLELARAQAEAMGVDGAGGDYRLRLTAPIAGVVARRDFVPGGRVDAGALLFTIVDPTTAWVEVHAPASMASAVAPTTRASFTVEGSTERYGTTRLVSVATVLNPETRTVPMVFEAAGSGSRFIVGQLARVAVPVGGTVSGTVIANGSIVDDNGTAVAYVQVGGETFERRVLNLGASDGARSHVISGIEPGEMVVTTGAYQLRLASMSDGEFAGGHTH